MNVSFQVSTGKLWFKSFHWKIRVDFLRFLMRLLVEFRVFSLLAVWSKIDESSWHTISSNWSRRRLLCRKCPKKMILFSVLRSTIKTIILHVYLNSMTRIFSPANVIHLPVFHLYGIFCIIHILQVRNPDSKTIPRQPPKKRSLKKNFKVYSNTSISPECLSGSISLFFVFFFRGKFLPAVGRGKFLNRNLAG